MLRSCGMVWLIATLTLTAGCGKDEPISITGNGSPGTHTNATGTLRVYFTQPERSPAEPDNIARALVGYIDAATQTLDVCAFELDNKIITEALVRAVQRKVRVRLVTETNYLNESGVQALTAVGVPVVDDKRDSALMHNKFMVFDGRAVWMGSMNFTENCAYKNNNHGIYIGDERLAANYATKFTWMFEQRKFGGLPSKSARIPNPQVTLADGIRVENYFSTHDRVASHVIDAIKQAKKSIHFLAFSYTHEGIGRAMLDRAAAGVEVKGVFEKSQAASSYSQYGKLRGVSNVEVYLDANPRNMHHKVIVIDDEIVVAGSFNFSEGADRENDENLVIIHNGGIAQQFEQEFGRVFAAAKRADGTGSIAGGKR